MKLFDETMGCLLDLLGRGESAHTEYLVIVGRIHQPSPISTTTAETGLSAFSCSII